MGVFSDELLKKAHLCPLEEWGKGEVEWYRTFLSQTDYIVIKAMEHSEAVNEPSLIEARQYCRDQINSIESEEHDTDT